MRSIIGSDGDDTEDEGEYIQDKHDSNSCSRAAETRRHYCRDDRIDRGGGIDNSMKS